MPHGFFLGELYGDGCKATPKYFPIKEINHLNANHNIVYNLTFHTRSYGRKLLKELEIHFSKLRYEWATFNIMLIIIHHYQKQNTSFVGNSTKRLGSFFKRYPNRQKRVKLPFTLSPIFSPPVINIQPAK